MIDFAPAVSHHAERVSASISPLAKAVDKWTLKQVQGDGGVEFAAEARKLFAVSCEGSVG